MVRDANGQYSISYVDMHGRTIATALAGNSPSNLKELQSNNTISAPTIKDNLLDQKTNIVNGRSIESFKTIVVSTQSDYEFTYKLNPEELKLLNCPDASGNQVEICYDCLYTLEITIRNQCGDYVRTYKKDNVSLAACNSTEGFLWTQIYNLPEGEYDITKRLSINEKLFTDLKARYLEHNTCKSLDEFKKEIYDAMTTMNSDCKNYMCQLHHCGRDLFAV
jgi:hypothetical protein